MTEQEKEQFRLKLLLLEKEINQKVLDFTEETGMPVLIGATMFEETIAMLEFDKNHFNTPNRIYLLGIGY